MKSTEWRVVPSMAGGSMKDRRFALFFVFSGAVLWAFRFVPLTFFW